MARLGSANRDLVAATVGVAVLALVVVGYEVWGAATFPTLTVAVAPVVTAIIGGPRVTALVGAVSAFVAVVLSFQSPTITAFGTLARGVIVAGVGATAALLAHQRDRREAKLVEGRTLAQLRGLTVALGRAVHQADVGQVIVDQGRTVLHADVALAYGVTDDGALKLLAWRGYDEADIAGFRRLPIDAVLPVADAVRRRTLLVLDRRAFEAEYPAVAGVSAGRSKLISVVPIDIDGVPLGVAFFGYHRTNRLVQHERSLTRALGDQCGQALQRARLYESTVVAEAHVRILQEITAALADAFTTGEVGAVVLRESVDRVGAAAGFISLLDQAEPGMMVLLSSVGFPDEDLAGWHRFPVDAPVPAGECLTTNTLLTYESRAEMTERYPVLDNAEATMKAGVWVPILSRQTPVGVLGYFFGEERAFDKAAHELFTAIATQCGQALERAELVEAEDERRERLEQAAVQASQLDRLTAEFSHALTPDDVVRTFVEVAVPELGATSGAMFLTEGQRLLRVGAVSTGDPRWPHEVELDSDHAVARTASSTRPLFLEGTVESGASAPEAGASTVTDPARAVVPLVAYGVSLGALMLRYPSAHPFTDDEQRHLVLVGQRCGEALERARLYEAERISALDAQRSAATLAELQQLTAELTGVLTVRDVAVTVLRAARPALGALGGAVLIRRGDEVEVVSADRIGELPERWPLESIPELRSVLDEGALALLEPSAPSHDAFRTSRVLAEAGIGSLALQPLLGRDVPVGVLAVAWKQRPGPHAVGLLATVGAVCGQALERASLFDAEHAIADTLQRSLLPTLPTRVGRLELQGRYRPGTMGTQVGGDWYDALVLSEDRVCLVVGDVEGRGVRAASAMGQLRAALRALTLTVHDPAELLRLLNEALLGADSPMVTMALAIVERDGHVVYCYAGHPPMFARSADGIVTELEGGRSVPLGVIASPTYRVAEAALPPGATLALFTDGLVERRGASIDEGIARFERSLGEPTDSLSLLADRLVGLAGEGNQADDVAVLLAKLSGGEERLEFRAIRRLSEVRPLRATLAEWLRGDGATEDDVLALSVGVAEAVVNSLQHAYPISGGTVDVTVERDGDTVRAEIVDRGKWRDPGATRDGKRGLVLMRGLTDVDIATTADGTTVLLSRRLQR